MTNDDVAHVLTGLKPLSGLGRPREVIRQFTPNWFAVNMGTGILAVALPQLPLVGSGLHFLGEALWLVNVVLFVVFSALYAARWLLFFDEARRIFGHVEVSMFFGTIPMALSTVIDGLVVFLVPGGGSAVADVALALWLVDVVASLVCGISIPLFMFTRQHHTLDRMTAIWLLPVVAPEVAAATGGIVVPHLTEAGPRLGVLVASYVLWGYSVPLSICILAILVLRMALHHVPPTDMAASSWLAVGPLGTGALALLVLGSSANEVLARDDMRWFGIIAREGGLLTAIVLWGFGLWWLLLALLVTARYFRSAVPFNLGWWAYTFPLGVYAIATHHLAERLHSPVFGAIAALLTLGLALMWIIVAARTVVGAWNGRLFVSPCITETR